MKYSGGYKTVLKIEQVEISELVDEETEKLQKIENLCWATAVN